MEFCMRLATKAMLHELSNMPEKNVVTSPISINVLLNMLAAGTQGRTMEQLLIALQSDNIEELNRASSQMMALFEPLNSGDQDGPVNRSSSQMMIWYESLYSGGEGPVMSVANGVWVDRKCPLQTSYKEAAETVYKAIAETVDFQNESGDVLQKINSWAEAATQGLIKNMLTSQDIDRNTTLVLGSALYFKGAWESAFKESRTQHDDFHLLSGETIKVPFMVSENSHFFGSFDGFKLLKLPYRCPCGDSKKFSMNVFLPDAPNGLEGLLQKINSNPLMLYRHCDMLSKVCLSKMWLPKFKFSYKFNPSDIMQKKMWIDLPFKVTSDFKEMANALENNKVYVDRIIHQSCIEVNEEGTEAAAVTYALTSPTSGNYGSPPPMPSFVADHPFVFMIREDVSGTVFFTGFVFNPLVGN